MQGRLEYPLYTKPDIFEGSPVPTVLKSGNHALIKSWREEQITIKQKNYVQSLASNHELSSFSKPKYKNDFKQTLKIKFIFLNFYNF